VQVLFPRIPPKNPLKKVVIRDTGKMASSGQSSELQSLAALVKTLTNIQMKEILRSELLAVSGVKTTLQLRIIECECRRFTIVFLKTESFANCTLFLQQISRGFTSPAKWTATKTSNSSYVPSPTDHFLLPPPHTSISLTTTLQDQHKSSKLWGQQCHLNLFQMVCFTLRWTGK
jgi:hypothetical protein